jgi:hypothetical protein
MAVHVEVELDPAEVMYQLSRYAARINVLRAFDNALRAQGVDPSKLPGWYPPHFQNLNEYNEFKEGKDYKAGVRPGSLRESGLADGARRKARHVEFIEGSLLKSQS